MNRAKWYVEINRERKRQIDKWGVQNHKPIEWCAILGEEVGEVQKAALEKHFNYDGANLNEYKKELIQTAAVCVSMLESLERNKYE